MKLLIAYLLLGIFGAGKAAEINLERLIGCLASVEGGRWGAQGGVCNMSYSAWEQHSKHSYRLSANREAALPVYREHLTTLLWQLKEARHAQTVAALACCWRHGFDGAQRRGFNCDEGARVANLYYDKTFAGEIP